MKFENLNKKYLWLLTIPAAALIAGGVYYSQQAGYYKEHFYANTCFGDLKVGDMTSQQVHQILADGVKDYTLTVKGKETEDVIRAEDISLHYQVEDAQGQDVIDAMLASQEPWKWFFRKDGDYSYDGFEKTYDQSTIPGLMEKMTCVNPKKKVKPKDAYLEYDEDEIRYVIVPDEDGNQVQKKKLEPQILEALDQWADAILVEDTAYKHAKVKADNKDLKQFVEDTEKYLSAEIDLVDDGHEVVVDREVIINFLNVDMDERTVELDESKVRHFINTKMDGTFDTVGKERSIKTLRSGTVTVSGGNYGKIVSTADELPKLMEEISSGTVTERRPLYRLDEKYSSNSGFGDTYVDVNISSQTLSYVKGGKEILNTSVVTGLPKDGRATPTGCYYVALKKTEYTMVKYNAFVHYWMNIYPEVGVGFHDATWRGSFGGQIYKSNGSHGCINMPLDAARKLYENISWGTPVVVHY